MIIRHLFGVYRTAIQPSARFSLFKRFFGRESQPQQSSTRPGQQKGEQQQQSKQKKPKQQQKEPQPGPFKRDLNQHVDFAELKRKHSKHIPQNIGKAGFEEVVFWCDGVVNFEEILVLMQGFNRAWPSLKGQPPQSYAFQEFKKKVLVNVNLCRNLDEMLIFSEFAKLYNIQEQQFWQKLEQKFCRKVTTLGSDSLSRSIDILMNFALLKKGEEIYMRMEQMVTYEPLNLTIWDVSRVLASMHGMRKGSAETVLMLVKLFLDNIEKADKESIVLVVPVLRFVQGVPSQTFTKLNDHMLKKGLIQSMSIYEMGEIAKGFGYENGNEQFWQAMEQRLMTQQITADSLPAVILGFLSTYRCSAKVFERVIPLVKQNLQTVHPRYLSEISKDMYMYEITDKQLSESIEGVTIEYLRNIDQVSLDDLIIIAKNYCMTRHGTRDIYKMLEVVIIAKMPQIKQNRFIFDSLMAVYNNSDLCSIDLHNLFKFLS